MTAIRIILICLLSTTIATSGMASGTHTHSHEKVKASGKESVQQISAAHTRIITRSIAGVLSRIDVIALDEMKKENDKLFTHKVTTTFTYSANGKKVDANSVALRFTKDHDDTGHFINMQPTEKGFEAFLFLPHKGEQHLMIAANIKDEKVRQFHFHFKVK